VLAIPKGVSHLGERMASRHTPASLEEWGHRQSIERFTPLLAAECPGQRRDQLEGFVKAEREGLEVVLVTTRPDNNSRSIPYRFK
jgi:hypothetical protein